MELGADTPHNFLNQDLPLVILIHLTYAHLSFSFRLAVVRDKVQFCGIQHWLLIHYHLFCVRLGNKREKKWPGHALRALPVFHDKIHCTTKSSLDVRGSPYLLVQDGFKYCRRLLRRIFTCRSPADAIEVNHLWNLIFW